MSNIPEDIYIPLNTKRDKKTNKGLLGIGIPNFAISLIEFLKDKIKAANGITFDTSTLTFKLGGELTGATEVNTNSYDFKIDNNESYFLATSAHPLTSAPFIGFIHDSVNDDKLYINGILTLGTESHNYTGVLDTTTYEETCIEVSYFEDFLAIPNNGKQAILLKGGALTTGGASTEVIIADNVVMVRAKGNTNTDILFQGMAHQGGGVFDDEQVILITGDGNVQLDYYENTRDDSATTTPINLLYTDVQGNVLVAPIEKVVYDSPVYVDDAAADADTNLLSGMFYKVTGSRAVYSKP